MTKENSTREMFLIVMDKVCVDIDKVCERIDKIVARMNWKKIGKNKIKTPQS